MSVESGAGYSPEAEDIQVPIEMYQISGFPDANLERYIESKAQDAEIAQLPREDITASLLKIKLGQVEEDTLPAIYDGLRNRNPYIKVLAADKISLLPIPDQEAIRTVLTEEVRESLRGSDPSSHFAAARLIAYATFSEQYALQSLLASKIDKSLSDTETKMSGSYARVIGYVEREERGALIRKALESSSVEARVAASGLIAVTPRVEQEELRQLVSNQVRELLRNSDIDVNALAAKMIENSSPTDKRLLKDMFAQQVRKALNSNDPHTQAVAADLIYYTRSDEQGELYAMACRNPLPEVQAKGLDYFHLVPKGERSNIIKQVLEGTDINLQAIVARYISTSYEGYLYKQFEPLVADIISEALDGSDPDTQKVAVSMIHCAPLSRRAELIEDCLTSSIRDTQVAALEVIEYAPIETRPFLVSLAVEVGLGEELIANPLYAKHPTLNAQEFSRKEFAKSGSGTTLLGGTLKDRVIIRHITAGAFRSWQEIFENYLLWQENGFDYVPIEPIQSYRVDRVEKQVDVFCGVLDLNLQSWQFRSGGLFDEEISAQKEKIDEVLSKINFEHGHAHDRNFVLRFFRDNEGKPDFTRAPRVYLIDFDESISSPISSK